MTDWTPFSVGGKASRDKGATAERELATMLSDELGFVVKRKLGQAREGGDDIQIEHYRLEVKRREKLAIDTWCKQVEDVAQPGEWPVVVYRRSGQKWRAVVPIELLIKAIREKL
jgi:Holliday junction resolvase